MQPEKVKRSFDRTSSTSKIIRFEDELLTQVESVAGKGKFSSWVKDACRQRLERESIKPKS